MIASTLDAQLSMVVWPVGTLSPTVAICLFARGTSRALRGRRRGVGWNPKVSLSRNSGVSLSRCLAGCGAGPRAERAGDAQGAGRRALAQLGYALCYDDAQPHDGGWGLS